MPIGKKGAKKKKQEDPEYVSNTMKQLYENKISAIQRKCDRRRQWAIEWAEAILQMEQEMEDHQKQEDENIRELKMQVKELKDLKLEKRGMIKKLTAEIEENLLYYKEKIADIEKNRIENEKVNSAEIADLEAAVTAVREFKENKPLLEKALLKRERQMDILQEKHEAKLEKLTEKRERRGERLQKDVEKQMLKFAEKYEKGMKMEGEVFQRKSELTADFTYIKRNIKLLHQKIPETTKNIKWIQEKEKERNDVFSEKHAVFILSKLEADSEQTKQLEEKGSERMELEMKLSPTLNETNQEDNDGRGQKFEQNPSPKFIDLKSKKDKRRLFQFCAVLKGTRKLLKESQALYLIPEGALAEENKINDRERFKRFCARRDAVFERRGYVLRLIPQILAHAKPNYQVDNFCTQNTKVSSENLSVGQIEGSKEGSFTDLKGEVEDIFSPEDLRKSGSSSLSRPSSTQFGESDQSGVARDLRLLLKMSLPHIWTFEGE